MKKQSGFTLIELLLVLAIIGIISAIAIPALLGQRERAKAKAVAANLDNVAAECVRVNDTCKELGTILTAGQVATTVLSMSNYAYPNAKNPYNGTSSAYISTGTGTGCVLLSAGSIVDPGTGVSYSGITIIGNYLQGGVAKTIQKVVALD